MGVLVKGGCNFNSLCDFLNQIADAVGSKVKANDSFLAWKKNAESVLSQLRYQINRIEMTEARSLYALSDQLATLHILEERLALFATQLESEHRTEQLDFETRHAFNELRKVFHTESEHLKTIRKDLRRRRDAAIEHQMTQQTKIIKMEELFALTEQGRSTLNDAVAIPGIYKEFVQMEIHACQAEIQLLINAHRVATPHCKTILGTLKPYIMH